MYPNLYFFVKSVFGIHIEGLKLINTFGLLVACAFLAGAWALTNEFKRRERLGWLQYTDETRWVGKGVSWTDVFWNGLFGFLIGWKFIGLLLNRSEALSDPQAYLLSGQGNLLMGLLFGALFAGFRWYSDHKAKLAKPEQKIVRIWPHDRVGDMIILAALFGFLGAKIFHNLENWEQLVADPWGAITSFSGLTFYGGLICAGIAIIVYARKRKINLWQLVDSFGPALMLAYAVGRLGCHVAGDGDWGIANSAYISNEQGKAILCTPAQYDSVAVTYLDYYKQAQAAVKPVITPSDILHKPLKGPEFLPVWLFAYTYPNNVLSEGINLPDCEGQWCARLPLPVYPTPLYETIFCGLLFLVLWRVRHVLQGPGSLFGLYLMFNGLERFFIEKIRVNTTYSLLGLHPSQAEIIALVWILLGALLFFGRRNAMPQKIDAA